MNMDSLKKTKKELVILDDEHEQWEMFVGCW